MQIDSRPLPTRGVSDEASRKSQNQFISSADEGWCGPAGTGLGQACSRAQLSSFGAAWEAFGSPFLREQAPEGSVDWRGRGWQVGKGSLGGAGPGFLEVMVSNRGCQGCSFWVTQLSALVCVIAVSQVGCSVNECLPLPL